MRPTGLGGHEHDQRHRGHYERGEHLRRGNAYGAGLDRTVVSPPVANTAVT
jgi:hypothetical protein